MAKSVEPIPPQLHSVTPMLVVKDAAAAIAFYRQAFGAEELDMRLTDPNGRIVHAEIKIGDSVVMLAEENPESGNHSPQRLGGTPVLINLYVADVDATFAQAIDAGAQEVIPVADQFYGDRSGRLRDPFHHLWIISTHIEDLSRQEMQRRMDAMYRDA